MVQNIVDFAMLTRDYRECSRYSRSSVRNPDLKNVKHVYYCLKFMQETC